MWRRHECKRLFFFCCFFFCCCLAFSFWCSDEKYLLYFVQWMCTIDEYKADACCESWNSRLFMIIIFHLFLFICFSLVILSNITGRVACCVTSRQVMANLNFQQPPRSIANSTLNNRAGPGYVGGSNSLSGHVTPTSGMFQQSNASFGPLSPNRSNNMQLGGGLGGPSLSNSSSIMNPSRSINIFGQRSFNDRRQMQVLNPMVSIELRHNKQTRSCFIDHFEFVSFDLLLLNQSSIGSFMQSRGYGNQGGNSALNSFHSVFGNNDTGTPPLLDLSEFPSLTNARGNDLPQANTLQPPGSKPYGE